MGIQGNKVFVGVWIISTAISLEENKCRVLGANKCRLTLADYDMCEDLTKEDV